MNEMKIESFIIDDDDDDDDDEEEEERFVMKMNASSCVHHDT
jgi:hypothetical protein